MEQSTRAGGKCTKPKLLQNGLDKYWSKLDILYEDYKCQISECDVDRENLTNVEDSGEELSQQLDSRNSTKVNLRIQELLQMRNHKKSAL